MFSGSIARGENIPRAESIVVKILAYTVLPAEQATTERARLQHRALQQALLSATIVVIVSLARGKQCT